MSTPSSIAMAPSSSDHRRPQLGLNMGPLIDLTPSLSAPLLGLFGKEDANPNPQHVAALAAELDRCGKPYEFHSFDNAGHAFFSVDRPNYRVEAANQGWGVIFDYFEKHAVGLRRTLCARIRRSTWSCRAAVAVTTDGFL